MQKKQGEHILQVLSTKQTNLRTPDPSPRTEKNSIMCFPFYSFAHYPYLSQTRVSFSCSNPSSSPSQPTDPQTTPSCGAWQSERRSHSRAPWQHRVSSWGLLVEYGQVAWVEDHQAAGCQFPGAPSTIFYGSEEDSWGNWPVSLPTLNQLATGL